MTYLFHIVNTMAVDGLAISRAKAYAAIHKQHPNLVITILADGLAQC